MAEQPQRVGGEQLSADQIINLASEEQRQLHVQRAAPPPPPLRPKLTRWGLVFSLPTLVIVLVFNLTDVSVAELLEPEPPPAVAKQRADQMLKALVAEVESFRTDYNELPETLFEIGMPERGEWSYSVTDGTYRIVGTLHGQQVTFTSTPVPPKPPVATEPETTP